MAWPLWADTSMNIVSGCLGCELAGPEKDPGVCYAAQGYETIPDTVKTNVGLPGSFWKPIYRENVLERVLSLPDLTGTLRQEQPWLNGLPRVVSVADMGDLFSYDSNDIKRGSPLAWLFDNWEYMAASPFQWVFLTRYPTRMEWVFNKIGKVPPNFWLGVSVSNAQGWRRIEVLEELPALVKFVAFEPLLEQIKIPPLLSVSWAIVGGLIHDRFHSKTEWLLDATDQLLDQHIRVFLMTAKAEQRVTSRQMPLFRELQRAAASLGESITRSQQ